MPFQWIGARNSYVHLGEWPNEEYKIEVKMKMKKINSHIEPDGMNFQLKTTNWPEWYKCWTEVIKLLYWLETQLFYF